MKFDLFKDGKPYGFGNPNMLATYTDEEIKEYYKEKWSIDVVIERDEKNNKIMLEKIYHEVKKRLLEEDGLNIHIKTISTVAKEMKNNDIPITAEYLYDNCIVDGLNDLVEYDKTVKKEMIKKLDEMWKTRHDDSIEDIEKWNAMLAGRGDRSKEGLDKDEYLNLLRGLETYSAKCKSLNKISLGLILNLYGNIAILVEKSMSKYSIEIAYPAQTLQGLIYTELRERIEK